MHALFLYVRENEFTKGPNIRIWHAVVTSQITHHCYESSIIYIYLTYIHCLSLNERLSSQHLAIILERRFEISTYLEPVMVQPSYTGLCIRDGRQKINDIFYGFAANRYLKMEPFQQR